MAREILTIWKNIRLARSKNGFANTNVKIVAHKESLDPEEEKVAWEAEIQREVKEASERHRLSQKREVAKYEEEMENWKKTTGNKEGSLCQMTRALPIFRATNKSAFSANALSRYRSLYVFF